jgi:cytoskeletal protein CcmA (bactofilin family)
MLRKLMGKEAQTNPPPPPASTAAEAEEDNMKLFERDEPEVSSVPVDQAPASETREDDATMNMKSEDRHADGATPAPSATREGLSVIGKTLFVKGELEAAEDMLIEGRVEGSIKHTARELTIGVSGVVNADIDAKNLIIEGTVEGNIVGAESVVICASADVRGNVYTGRISIADGAQFSGTVDMDLSKSPRH